MAGRKSDVDVVGLSLTLDLGHVELLDRIVRLGLYGRNRNEVASALIRHWLVHNLVTTERLYEELGISTVASGSP